MNVNLNYLYFIAGQIITAVKEGCKRAFQVQPQRLVTPMYNCNIIVDSIVLGEFLTFIFLHFNYSFTLWFVNYKNLLTKSHNFRNFETLI